MTDHSYFDTHCAPVGHPLLDLSNKLTAMLRQRRKRRSLKTLLKLEDHILHDIGLSRDDIQDARTWPLSVDVETELRRATLTGRAG